MFLSSFHPFFFRLSLTSLLRSLSLSSSRVLSPPSFFGPSSFDFFSIYRREKVLGPLLVRLGAGFAGGWSATTRDSKAPLPCFRQGERPVGQWLWSMVQSVGLRVGGLEEIKGGLKKKNHFSSLLQVRGRGRRKGNSAIKNDTVRSFFFFFLLCMKRRRFG